MPFALGIVTVLALLMTIGMGVVTWRLMREERRRSAARLSALAAELNRQDTCERPPVRLAPSTERPVGPVDIPLQTSTPSGVTEGPVAALSIAPTDLFQPRSEDTGGWTRRLAGFGAAGLVLATIVSVAILTFPDGQQVDAAVKEPQVPVELLALTHELKDGMLAISGTVRNPGNGLVEQHMTVIALALNSEGVVVATGRAPLEQERLSAGTESTFAVSLPVVDATRYRISFLFDDMTVPHLDRRVAPAGVPSQTES